MTVVKNQLDMKLMETEPMGTSRIIGGRKWILETGFTSHRWRAADCMCTVGLSDKGHIDMPYAVHGVAYPDFDTACRYAVRKHNQIVRDAKKILDRWSDPINQVL
jgi:hypothetical protein